MSLIASSVLVLMGLQNSAETVSYETAGSRLPVVLSSLGEQAGIELELAPELSKEVLIVRFEDVAIETALNEIATSVGGLWTDTPKGKKLSIDNKLMKAQEREFYAKNLKDAKEALQGLKDSIDPQKIFKDMEEEERLVAIQEYDPEASLQIIVGLMTQLSPEFYAGMKEDERVVFSTSPNRMQRPLNLNKYRFAINNWVRQHNQMVDAQVGVDYGMGEEYEEFLKMFGNSIDPKRVEASPTFGMFVIEKRRDTVDSIVCRLSLYDQAGNAVLNSTEYMGTGNEWVEMIRYSLEEETEEKPEEVDKKAGDEIKLERSAEAKLVLEIADGMDPANMQKKPSEEAVQTFLRMDLHDPISLSGGDLVLASAKALKKNLVACLSDDEMQYQFTAKGDYTVGNVRLRFTKNEDVIFEDSSSWWKLRPKNFARSRDDRMDRLSATQLLIDARKVHVPTLDMIANFAINNDPIEDNYFMSRRAMALAPAVISYAGIFGGTSDTWEYLQLYGHMSTGQRRAFKSGQPVRLNTLSSEARALGEKLVYGAQPKLAEIDRRQQRSAVEEMMETIGMGVSMFSDELGGKLNTEPTIAGVGGLGGAVIQARVREAGYVMQIEEDQSPNFLSMPLGVLEASFFKMLMETPEMASELVNINLDKLRYGTRLEIDGALFVRGNVGLKFKLTDHSQPNMDSKYSMQNLPSDFASEVDKTSAALKKSSLYKMVIGGMGAGGGRTIRP